MNKKVLIPLLIVGLLLVAGVVYLAVNLHQQKQANEAMQELAELDKKEMENEYQQFANQYSRSATTLSWRSFRQSKSERNSFWPN